MEMESTMNVSFSELKQKWSLVRIDTRQRCVVRRKVIYVRLNQPSKKSSKVRWVRLSWFYAISERPMITRRTDIMRIKMNHYN